MGSGGSGAGWTRRALGAGMASLAVTSLAARAGLIESADRTSRAERGRIDTTWRVAERGRPMGGHAEGGRAPTGALPLGLETGRDGLLYVPRGADPRRATPLVVLLHGLRGNARDTAGLLQGLADRAGFLLLVPESRGRTWDALLGEFGPDVEFLGRALERAFRRHAVDPTHVALAGFSDGASYALSLGLANGDLFTHVIAFSPSRIVPAPPVGRPRLFVSHGTRDAVLPIDRCSRVIVPEVRRAGYDVTYREFDGPHSVPLEVAVEAVR